MFEVVFYMFSILLAYIDYKKFIVPNKILIIFFILLIIFGLIENRLDINSFFIAFTLLVFFIGLILINPHMILGGGDIKYIMIVAIFLQPILFPFFLIITGVMQSLFLLYGQTIQGKKKVAMLPAMLISVVLSELYYSTTYFPFEKVGV